MVRPRGDLFIRESEKLEECVGDLVRAGYELFAVDLSGVGYIGSSGIGAIVWLHERLRQLKGRVIYACVPDKVKKVLEMMNLTMLEQVDSVETAMEILSKKGESADEN